MPEFCLFGTGGKEHFTSGGPSLLAIRPRWQGPCRHALPGMIQTALRPFRHLLCSSGGGDSVLRLELEQEALPAEYTGEQLRQASSWVGGYARH